MSIWEGIVYMVISATIGKVLIYLYAIHKGVSVTGREGHDE